MTKAECLCDWMGIVLARTRECIHIWTQLKISDRNHTSYFGDCELVGTSIVLLHHPTYFYLENKEKRENRAKGKFCQIRTIVNPRRREMNRDKRSAITFCNVRSELKKENLIRGIFLNSLMKWSQKEKEKKSFFPQ